MTISPTNAEPGIPDEKWCRVPGHLDYLISTEGRVWSKKTNHLMVGARDTDGHHAVKLDGKLCRRHRLALLAWDAAGKTEQNCCALHGPGGINDNRLSNLYWGTQKQNVGPDRERDDTAHRPNVTHREVARMQELVTEGMSVREIARRIGRNLVTVRRHLAMA